MDERRKIMNEQIANALGIRFIKKGGRGGRSESKFDVSITKNKKQYRFSFSERAAKKLGEYVKIAPANNRIYFAPSLEKDEYAYKLTTPNKGGCLRKAVQISFGMMPNIDELIGDYELKYFNDLDAYYISKNREVKA